MAPLLPRSDSGINDIENEELRRMKNAQNHAWSDIDRDGDLDLLVGGRDTGGGRPNFLFRNDIGAQNRWMAFELVGDGDTINRDAIGARVTVNFDNESIIREKKSSRGLYTSEDTRVLHVGIGDRPCATSIEVRWPNGETVSLDMDTVIEGSYLRIEYPDVVGQ